MGRQIFRFGSVFSSKKTRLSFRKKIKYFLVHHSGFTNEQAQKAIDSEKLIVNDVVISENVFVNVEDEIVFDKKMLQQKIKHKYILFYKPKGIETTHNKKIENSLVNKFPEFESLFFAGRLDKDSEGLLFLTTDGKLANNLAHPIFKKEKEYIVQVNKKIDKTLKSQMETGVVIMGNKTAPCLIEIIENNTFKITLTEGKNRQIRRMCYKLGYEVVFLKRTKIADWKIGNMKAGEWREVEVIASHLPFVS